MNKFTVYDQPLWIYEALELLTIKANNLLIAYEDNEMVDKTSAKIINTHLEKILNDLDLSQTKTYFEYYKNYKTSLAKCLLNSFATVFELDDKEFVKKKIAAFMNSKINSIELSERLNIQYEPETTAPLKALLDLKLEDKELLALIKTFSDPFKTLDTIYEMIETIKNKLEILFAELKEYPIYEEYLTFYKYDKTRDLLKKANVDYDGTIIVAPSLVHYRSLMINMDDDRKDPLLIVSGFSLKVGSIEKYDFIKDSFKERLDHFIKVLNDKSKLEIIKLLKEKEMYGAEIAKATNLKTSTISYHVDALMNAGIIKAKRLNNKIYYQYDKANALKILDYLKKIFE